MCSVGGLLQGALGFTNNIAAQNQALASQQEYAFKKRTEWEVAKRQADEEAKMRAAAGIINMNQLNVRQQEINEAAAENKTEVDIAAMRAKASAALEAGESGVTGNTVQRLLNSIESEATRRKNNFEATRSNQVSAAQLEKHAVKQSATMQPLLGVIPEVPSGSPNYLSAALSGLGKGAASYDFSTLFRKKSQTSSTVVKNPLLG